MEEKPQREIKVKPLLFESYVATIKNSVGTKMFRNFYAEVNGKKTDVTVGGTRSCAFFISTILTVFGLIKEVHLTYQRCLEDMEESGWYKIKKPRIGSVLVWERQKMEDGWFGHIGFYLGKGEAISNRTSERIPQRHHWTYNDTRKVTAIYWHRKLRRDK